MLKLTISEIFTVKWPKFRPNISDLGIPGGIAPQKEKIHPEPICTIMQSIMPIGATVADISVNSHEKKPATTIPSHTNIWQIKKHRI